MEAEGVDYDVSYWLKGGLVLRSFFNFSAAEPLNYFFRAPNDANLRTSLVWPLDALRPRVALFVRLFAPFADPDAPLPPISLQST